MKNALLYLVLLITNSVLCQETKTVNQIDTSDVAVLPAGEYVFNKPSVGLSLEELLLAEAIVRRAFSDNKIPFSGSLGCDNLSIVPFYKRQYFPVIENGEKQVYVNCFVDRNNEFPFWRKHAVIVCDRGGFVHLVINLAKKEYTSFKVSQSAFRKLRVVKTTVNSTSL
ncbi:MAG TPA: hypothetical protein VF609_06880 [Flavisolibacter sp.]|jgi:hypothetical protein